MTENNGRSWIFVFSVRFALELWVWKANETFWRVLLGCLLSARVLFLLEGHTAGALWFSGSAAISLYRKA